jgi:hypothetical protein
MEIIGIELKPCADWVEPAVEVKVKLSYQNGEGTPLNMRALFKTEDQRVLGMAHEAVRHGNERRAYDVAARDMNFQVATPDEIRLVLPLSPRLVEHIETARQKNRKRDVVLSYTAEVSYLGSNAELAWLHRTSQQVEGRHGSPPLELVGYQNRVGNAGFHSQTSNLWLVSGNGSATFLQGKFTAREDKATISASDWTHDYLAQWRGSRYAVFEVPIPAVVTSDKTIAERLERAIQAAETAERYFAQGEWSDTCEKLRPVWELFRNWDDLKKLLERDGYDVDAVSALTTSLAQQFAFASKFMHVLDQSGKAMRPEITAKREDAQLLYMLALSLLNLVARKSMRLAPAA